MPGCSLSAAENFLQRIVPPSYSCGRNNPIFGDLPRPVDRGTSIAEMRAEKSGQD
jgi:hypothetical protein|eukprot:COSAG01_NODE_886_length_12921_cov_115.252652_11_plen_55_part_00